MIMFSSLVELMCKINSIEPSIESWILFTLVGYSIANCLVDLGYVGGGIWDGVGLGWSNRNYSRLKCH